MSKEKLADGFGRIMVEYARKSGETEVDPDNPEHRVLACLASGALVAVANGYSEEAFLSLARSSFRCAAPTPPEDEHPF